MSVALSLFHPLDVASLFGIRIQLLLRLIWQKALKSWIEAIPQDIAKRYLDWLQKLSALKELSIDRYYGWQRGSNVELRVFADASEMGFVSSLTRGLRMMIKSKFLSLWGKH